MVIDLLVFLAGLYRPIVTAVFVGGVISYVLGLPRLAARFRKPPQTTVPAALGKFLFFIGVPVSVVNFLRRADLTGSIWVAPVVAWFAIAIALLLAWLWIRPARPLWSKPSRGTFLLASMVGNTGYIGFPIVLLTPQLGPDYFGWALFYDVLGTFFGAYVIGVIIGTRYGKPPRLGASGTDFEEESDLIGETSVSFRVVAREVLKNPTMIAFVLGLALRQVEFPELLSLGLNGFAWAMVMLALVLMGMRLQQLDSWGALKTAAAASSIKMITIPLLVGMALTSMGIEGPPRLALVIQSGMPSAFAALVISENYSLNRDLAVTTVGLTSALLLFTLPIWLWGFGTW